MATITDEQLAELRAALRKYGEHLAGCPRSQHPHALGTATTMPCTCGFDAALAAVPMPPQADDRLAWAEAGAKAMRIAAMTALYEAGSDEHVIVRALDAAAIARRAVVDAEGGGR